MAAGHANCSATLTPVQGCLQSTAAGDSRDCCVPCLAGACTLVPLCRYDQICNYPRGTCRGLQARLDKRRSELERAERRLSTLTAVRPAYMDEYERLQGELQDLFTLYLQRFR